MQTLKVKKTGKNIQKCIEIPDAYLDRELEITIRPLPAKERYGDRIRAIYLRYPNSKPFEEISDPRQWQQRIRNEW